MAQEARLVKNGEVGDHRLSDAEFLATFRLPRYEERVDALRGLNPLGPRETRIVFDEERHFLPLAVPSPGPATRNGTEIVSEPRSGTNTRLMAARKRRGA